MNGQVWFCDEGDLPAIYKTREPSGCFVPTPGLAACCGRFNNGLQRQVRKHPPFALGGRTCL